MPNNNSDGGIWGKVFEKPKNVVSRKIAGELFLVPVAGELADMQRIFALTPVAEFIWERLDGRKSIGDIRNEILDSFEAEKGEIDIDIEAFAGELIAEGLLREAAE
jgi:hypothetical protein